MTRGGVLVEQGLSCPAVIGGSWDARYLPIAVHGLIGDAVALAGPDGTIDWCAPTGAIVAAPTTTGVRRQARHGPPLPATLPACR